MRNTFLKIILFIGASTFAQNNALVLNGAYVVMNGGAFNNNIQLVVNQPNALGIVRNSGHIITENQYNYVRWNTGAQSGNYVFPFGYSNTDYLPLGLNKTTTTSSAITASTWGTPQNNLPFSDSTSVSACNEMNSVMGGGATASVVDRWWDIKKSAAMTADITFRYRGSENTTATPTGVLNAQQWNGSTWLPPIGSAAGVTSGVGALTATGISSFSPFVLVNSGGLLPIQLLSFTTECNNKNVMIKWSTATESNNAFFTIERSTDVTNWTIITTQAGAGNSNQQLNYFYEDVDAFNDAEVIYFRLKQTDFNGHFEYFEISPVTNCKTETNWVVYPNPATDAISIDFNNGTATNQRIELYSTDGKLVRSSTDFSLNGRSYKLSVEDLDAGIYFLTVCDLSKNTKQVKKLIVH